MFTETHENFSVLPSTQLQQAADERFGEETYYAKVDATLPERTRPQWMKRNGNQDAE